MVDQEPSDKDPYARFAPHQEGARKLFEGIAATFADPFICELMMRAEGQELGSGRLGIFGMTEVLQRGAKIENPKLRTFFFEGYASAVTESLLATRDHRGNPIQDDKASVTAVRDSVVNFLTVTADALGKRFSK